MRTRNQDEERMTCMKGAEAVVSPYIFMSIIFRAFGAANQIRCGTDSGSLRLLRASVVFEFVGLGQARFVRTRSSDF